VLQMSICRRRASGSGEIVMSFSLVFTVFTVLRILNVLAPSYHVCLFISRLSTLLAICLLLDSETDFAFMGSCISLPRLFCLMSGRYRHMQSVIIVCFLIE
jgi:hypothetical protein